MDPLGNVEVVRRWALVAEAHRAASGKDARERAYQRDTCAPEDAARRVGAGEADVVVLAHDALASLDQLLQAQCGRASTSIVALSGTMSGAEARDALRAGVSDVVDPASGEHALLAAIARAAR